MNKTERNTTYIREYRHLRQSVGWKQVNRLVPEDLAIAIKLLIAQHKAKHFKVWTDVPTPTTKLKD